MFGKTILAAVAAACVALPVAASEIMVEGAYARASSPVAKTGGVFMTIMNRSGEDDRLVAARSDRAARAELHTHVDMGGGVMKMTHVEEGFAIPAGESLMLARGGKHVMLMGLTAPLEQGETIPLVLTFEKAGDVAVEVPVDYERKDTGMSHGMSHGGGMKHDN